MSLSNDFCLKLSENKSTPTRNFTSKITKGHNPLKKFQLRQKAFFGKIRKLKRIKEETPDFAFDEKKRSTKSPFTIHNIYTIFYTLNIPQQRKHHPLNSAAAPELLH